MTYGYRVVTMNGHGVHGPTHRSLRAAKRMAERLTQREREGAYPLGPYEIERVLDLEGGGHQCWMRRRSRWVQWAHDEPLEAREPDWPWLDASGETREPGESPS
jgi:hypothetical protein